MTKFQKYANLSGLLHIMRNRKLIWFFLFFKVILTVGDVQMGSLKKLSGGPGDQKMGVPPGIVKEGFLETARINFIFSLQCFRWFFGEGSHCFSPPRIPSLAIPEPLLDKLTWKNYKTLNFKPLLDILKLFFYERRYVRFLTNIFFIFSKNNFLRFLWKNFFSKI